MSQEQIVTVTEREHTKIKILIDTPVGDERYQRGYECGARHVLKVLGISIEGITDNA